VGLSLSQSWYFEVLQSWLSLDTYSRNVDVAGFILRVATGRRMHNLTSPLHVL
jgi:hypothetical protein